MADNIQSVYNLQILYTKYLPLEDLCTGAEISSPFLIANLIFCLKQMTHVMVWRGRLPEDGVAGFWHHGIVCSDGEHVVHYAGMDGVKTLSNARIMRTRLSQFQIDPTRLLHIVQYNPELHRVIYAPCDVEERALTRVGHARYDLLFDNCESFARWCVTGREVSQQSTGALVGAAAGLASILIGGGPLGALLTSFVTCKCWDRRENRSAHREPPPDDERE